MYSFLFLVISQLNLQILYIYRYENLKQSSCTCLLKHIFSLYLSQVGIRACWTPSSCPCVVRKRKCCLATIHHRRQSQFDPATIKSDVSLRMTTNPVSLEGKNCLAHQQPLRHVSVLPTCCFPTTGVTPSHLLVIGVMLHCHCWVHRLCTSVALICTFLCWLFSSLFSLCRVPILALFPSRKSLNEKLFV